MDDGAPASADRIVRKSFDEPDGVVDFRRGRALVLQLGDEQAWRSELDPGWSWDDEVKPYSEGATSCPLIHREYVVAGRIRYVMDDGTDVEAGPGDAIYVPPGHRAWVLGDERCILIDW